MIQDYIIALVQWGLAAALIPTLIHKDNKPTLVSSIWTGSLLLVLSGKFATLELWNGSLSSFIVSGIWFTLGYQRYKIDKAEKSSTTNPHTTDHAQGTLK